MSVYTFCFARTWMSSERFKIVDHCQNEWCSSLRFFERFLKVLENSNWLSVLMRIIMFFKKVLIFWLFRNTEVKFSAPVMVYLYNLSFQHFVMKNLFSTCTTSLTCSSYLYEFMGVYESFKKIFCSSFFIICNKL